MEILFVFSFWIKTNVSGVRWRIYWYLYKWLTCWINMSCFIFVIWSTSSLVVTQTQSILKDEVSWMSMILFSCSHIQVIANNNPHCVEALKFIISACMKIHSNLVLITTSRQIHFLWNLFFLFLLPAPCAAFSVTMCWYFFLLLLEREKYVCGCCFTNKTQQTFFRALLKCNM